MKFDELNLSPEIMSGLKDVQYEEATPLQQSIIPQILEGGDLLIEDRGDKGKYGAVVIPALEKIVRDGKQEDTRVLILTPNPEEAKQIDELVWALGYHKQIECASIDLDGERAQQEEALHSGVPVLVGNPGPLIDIMEENLFIFRNVDLVVVDKAVEMLSLNLFDRIRDIQRRVVSEHQSVLFAEELTEEVKELANLLLEDPEIEGFEGASGKALEEPPSVPDNLSQGYINVPPRMKISTLMAHIEQTPGDTCVIFTASKRGTDRLYKAFQKRDRKATSLHNKLSEEKRQQRLSNFTDGDVQYLLVSEIPAQELKLERVTQVINYDVPGDPDEYRFRANMVETGKASRIVSLVSKQDQSDINELKNELGQAPQKLPLPEEVQKKLEERKSKKSNGRGKRDKKSRPSGKKSSGRKKERDEDEDKLELPRPSYDKLSGGRTGHKDDEKEGVVEFFKRLFSS